MTVPERTRTLRWIVIALGIFIFVWLGREDSDVLGVTVLGCFASLLSITLWVNHHFGGQQFKLRTIQLALPLLGLAIGLGTSFITVALMTFKNVRHAHAFPDYPWKLIDEIIARAPIWGLAGVLFGVALGLSWQAFNLNQPIQSDP